MNVGDNYPRKGKLKLQVKTNSEIVLTCISEAHVWEFEGEQWREEREDSQEYYGGWAVLSEGADTGFGKQQAQEGWEVEKKKEREEFERRHKGKQNWIYHLSGHKILEKLRKEHE